MKGPYDLVFNDDDATFVVFIVPLEDAGTHSNVLQQSCLQLRAQPTILGPKFPVSLIEETPTEYRRMFVSLPDLDNPGVLDSWRW